MKVFRDYTPATPIIPATPSAPISKALKEIVNAAEWRLELHCRGREFPQTPKPKETRTPTPSEVRKAKVPAHSKFEHIDGYFFNRRRHSFDDPS